MQIWYRPMYGITADQGLAWVAKKGWGQRNTQEKQMWYRPMNGNTEDIVLAGVMHQMCLVLWT